MKKLLIVLIVLSMLLTISGCKKPQETVPNQTSTATQSTEVTIDPTVRNDIQQKPMYAISLVPQSETITDATGDIRFIHSYQNISLVLPEPEIADKIILDQLNRLDQVAQYAEELKCDSLDSEFFNGIPFMYSLSYTPMRFDSVLFSLYEDEMIFMGGIHPNTYGHFYTYDLLSGDKLKLSDVLTANITTKEVIDLITMNLTDTEYLWDDYSKVISELLDVGLGEYQSWYFSNKGLCFFFDPYILAPYAAGPVTVEIPYSDLVEILKGEYFPAEVDKYAGYLVANEFSVDAQKDFTQFAEIILEEAGTKLLLSAEGAITDITITAETIKDGNTGTVFAIQSLTPGDAIMVEFDPTTTKLQVMYDNGDQYEAKTINITNGNILIS